MTDKKYTDKELLFLGYLAAEADGDIDQAMEMAGYAKSSKSWLIKHLKMEMIEVASNMLTTNSIKAARSIVDLLKNPTHPGAATILKAAGQILDRAGVTKQEDLTVKVPKSGLIILPAKNSQIKVEEESSEDNDG